jgi:DNA-binding response OmpR family regulator
MNRILLVEDHERLAKLIAQGLSAAGIASDHMTRSDEAWSALSQIPYAALVLDRGLDDGDGLNLLRRLRSEGKPIPCLVLTAREALNDRIEGLNAGADDYLAKPFAMDELIARVRALLRRPANRLSPEPAHGDIVLDPAQSTMQCQGERGSRCLLSASEMQIMLLLAHKQGDTVRRTALEAAAWGLSDAVTPNALDVALHRLRKKLREIGSQQRVVNVRGLGYALRSGEEDQEHAQQ